jgi:ribosome-interacting GTPase 1
MDFMPANLPPQYIEAEKRYRDAKTPEAKVEILEEMLMIMPKHKGTDKLRADLRRRIAKFKSQAQHKKGVSKRDTAYSIDKEGAAQVIIVGPPNVGKSSLVAALTNASPEVTDFPHSTWNPTPGMAPYENIQFQLIDTPPISRDYRDPWMADLIRRADIVVILLDLQQNTLQGFEDSLFALEQIRAFPEGLPIPKDLHKRPFIKKVLVVVNKMDELEDVEDYEVFVELAEVKLPCMGISIHKGHNLKDFLENLYKLSGIVRTYTKAPGKDPDLTAPFVLHKGSTLEDLAGKIHKDFVDKLKYAKIWGMGVYDGQMVQRDYVLQDGDVIEIHI